MRVAFDSGILLAALITSGTPPDLIYRAWRKEAFELLTSEWQLGEIRRVSLYPKLRKYLKHGLSFWAYLRDRLAGANTTPWLPSMIFGVRSEYAPIDCAHPA